MVYCKWFLLMLISLVFLGPLSGVISAGSTLPSLDGMAYYVPILSENVDDGMVVSLIQGEYVLSSTAYDNRMVGVVELSPSVSLDLIGGQSALPVVSDKYANVVVSAHNGDIVRGDLLTSSEFPGVAMKAIESGYVLGQALEDFSGSNPGTIKAAIDIYYYTEGGLGEDSGQDNLSDSARDGLYDFLAILDNASRVEGSMAFRYLLSTLILLACIGFGFYLFGRVAQRGVEALGRNPLARRTIMIGLVLNVAVTLLIIFSGLLVSFYILRT